MVGFVYFHWLDAFMAPTVIKADTLFALVFICTMAEVADQDPASGSL